MFKLIKNDTGNYPPYEALPAGAGTYSVGQALAFSSGVLVSATGTTAPEYISQESGAKAANDLITCIRVSPSMTFKTALGAAGTLTPGTKYTIHTDGLTVTATSTSGVFEAIRAEGAAIGDAVYGRFN